MDPNTNPYNQSNQPYGQPNQPYGQPNQPYGQPNQSYMNNGYMQPPHGEVKDLFCIALLIVMPLRMIVAIITNVMTVTSMNDISYSSVMDGSYMNVLTAVTASPGYTMLTILSNVLLIAYIIFIILDIVGIHKANYKITGLVLFGIFLNYGYYIWRAYILGRKKTGPVIYTVCYSLLAVANVIITVVCTMDMTLGMMGTMY